MSVEAAKSWTATARSEKDVGKKLDAIACAIEELANAMVAEKGGKGAEKGLLSRIR